jgi:thiamine-phosphate pyrophosphorylase
MGPNLATLLRLMLVTDDALLEGRELIAVCLAAVRGGVTSVELRLKQPGPRELLAHARELVAALPVPVLVNDRLDVALAAGAAGVHLGPDDLPVALARHAAPEGFIVGASVGAKSGAIEGGRGADYWGVGPWRTTFTKRDSRAPLGPEGFGTIVAAAGGVPCVAIGGVLPEDSAAVRQRGGVGIAVAAGILGSADVEAAARRYASA